MLFCKPELSLSGGILRLLSTISAAGLLVAPGIFRDIGLLYGVLLVYFIAAISLLALLLQVQVIRYVPLRYSSYFTLAQITSPSLAILFDISIALKGFLSCVIELIVIRDFLPEFSVGTKPSIVNFLIGKRCLLGILTFLIIGPLCWSKGNDLFKYLTRSIVGTVAFFTAVLVYYSIVPPNQQGDDTFTPEIDHILKHPSIFNAVAILFFIFGCQHSMFGVINEQKDKLFRGIRRIAFISVSIQLGVVLLICTSGYMAFKSNMKDNIINNFPNTVAVIILKIMFILLMIITFPCQCYAQRAAFHRIYNWATTTAESEDIAQNEYGHSRNSDASTSNIVISETTPLLMCEGHTIPIEELVEEGSVRQFDIRPVSETTYTIMTIGIVLCAYAFTLLSVSLVELVVVIGSTSSTLISLILPGLFAYRLVGSEYISYEGHIPFLTKFYRDAGLILAIFGILIITTFLIFILPLDII
ncbi:hypothetical protein DAKH74_020860 [Maudiozyma humilis]|uniref:Amino acid transporter transmembrane domain-containing protein n=1 Tax=Maudiozyma humilis TaxID=51915 RepID=A0AAV5RVK2_MAUHU|nr:hypothetical protein DAKH74_020860 [Kazachstania humilis]